MANWQGHLNSTGHSKKSFKLTNPITLFFSLQPKSLASESSPSSADSGAAKRSSFLPYPMLTFIKQTQIPYSSPPPSSTILVQDDNNDNLLQVVETLSSHSSTILLQLKQLKASLPSSIPEETLSIILPNILAIHTLSLRMAMIPGSSSTNLSTVKVELFLMT